MATLSPSWLEFDPSTRTFSGTPSSTDIGTFTLELNAHDNDGTAAGNLTLLVVEDDGISVGLNVTTQLESFGGVDGTGGIVLTSLKPFTWKFAEDTFTSSKLPVEHYYAVSTGKLI